MKKIAFISPGPGTGKTTAMINIGAGLHLQGKRVLLSPHMDDALFDSWLFDSASNYESTVYYHDKIGVSVMGDYRLGIPNQEKDYDYHLTEFGNNEVELAEISTFTIIVCCVKAGNINRDNLIVMEQNLRKLSVGQRGIDLIIPGMAHAGEWENNSRQLFRLADMFGEDRIADFIPYCEAIHDLPLLKQHVWMLPDHYRNRKEAFKRLLDRIVSI
ncbi:ParA family protein [Syntrophomonas palmitatica]|uniref:ParA family protein n=1 Tax=Syntrophomonas palmitatica TaxID=402877 RepID=UPI0012EDCA3F|nr:hypothetical protein [Syntrophomonas palmitatica]